MPAAAHRCGRCRGRQPGLGRDSEAEHRDGGEEQPGDDSRAECVWAYGVGRVVSGGGSADFPEHGPGRLNKRFFCLVSAPMGNNPDTVTKNLPRIAELRSQLFQGDLWIDHFAYGEANYTPAHDNMVNAGASSGPRTSSSGPRGARDREGGLADARAHDAREFLRRLPRSDRAYQQGVSGAEPPMVAHSRRAVDGGASGAHAQSGYPRRHPATRHHHGCDLQPRARRSLLRHAAAQHDSRERRPGALARTPSR